jgi:pimeloyl-ACP methyl ester carboxylesterase
LGDGLEPLARVSRPAVVDIPGQPGLSDGRVPGLSWGGYTAWLADVLDGLDVDQVDLIGASAGAFLAARAAPRLGGRVRRVVLCAPAGFVIPWGDRRSLGALALHLLRPSREHTDRFVRACLLGPDQDMPPEARAELVEALFRSSTGFTNRSRLPRMLSGRELRCLEHDTLLLVGALDPNFSAERTVARARRNVPGLARAVIVPGHGHMLELSATAMEHAAAFLASG